MASISCQHIYKIYPGATAPSVTDFNLEIQDKEFIIFVGPSGCGKSTTLRMIAGLEEISKGEMYIGGRLINDVPPKDRDIAMVFQSYALYPHMTVYKNIAFGLELRKMPKDEIDKKVRQAAEILDITQYLDRKPKALSGGQRQRISLARAILKDAPIVVLDEATAYADPENEEKMEAAIAELVKGKTLVVIAHKLPAIMNADQICVIDHGKLVAAGKHQDLIRSCPEYQKLWKAAQDSAEWKVHTAKEGK